MWTNSTSETTGLTFSTSCFFYHSSHVVYSLWRYSYSVCLLIPQLTAESPIQWMSRSTTQYLLLKALYWSRKVHFWTVPSSVYCPYSRIFLISIENEAFKGLIWLKGTDFFSGKNPVWHLYWTSPWPLKSLLWI